MGPIVSEFLIPLSTSQILYEVLKELVKVNGSVKRPRNR